jgi:microcystin-dependent protein
MALDFPNTPVDGQVYDNYYYDASMQSWRAYGTVNLAVPAGIINQYGGSVAPEGYLLCNGQSVSTGAYPALFAAIGYTYGGSGSSFNIPNLQNRVPVGRGTDTEFDTLGETGGTKTVTLDATQIPAHSHPNTLSNATVASSGHTHHEGDLKAAIGAVNGNAGWLGYPATSISPRGPTSVGAYTVFGNNYTANTLGFNHYTPVYGTTAAPNGTSTVGISNANNSGGGQAHTNLQPYIVLNYIIKT